MFKRSSKRANKDVVKLDEHGRRWTLVWEQKKRDDVIHQKELSRKEAKNTKLVEELRTSRNKVNEDTKRGDTFQKLYLEENQRSARFDKQRIILEQTPDKYQRHQGDQEGVFVTNEVMDQVYDNMLAIARYLKLHKF